MIREVWNVRFTWGIDISGETEICQCVAQRSGFFCVIYELRIECPQHKFSELVQLFNFDIEVALDDNGDI
jgi:hypothetical protein